MQAIDTAAAPTPLSEGFVRGGPLAERDPAFRPALSSCAGLPPCAGLIDLDRVAVIWEEALRAPAWSGPPVWLHADLLPGNLLVRHGRLAGVLDFGTICTGDPAYDLTPARTCSTRTPARRSGTRSARTDRPAPEPAAWSCLAE